MSNSALTEMKDHSLLFPFLIDFLRTLRDKHFYMHIFAGIYLYLCCWQCLFQPFWTGTVTWMSVLRIATTCLFTSSLLLDLPVPGTFLATGCSQPPCCPSSWGAQNGLGPGLQLTGLHLYQQRLFLWVKEVSILSFAFFSKKDPLFSWFLKPVPEALHGLTAFLTPINLNRTTTEALYLWLPRQILNRLEKLI